MTKSVYDKTKWPLQTPDLFWALSDNLEDIAFLYSRDDNFAEYQIETSNLSEGGLLNHINALRNITLKLSSFSPVLRKCLRSASLCLGTQTLQSVEKESEAQDICFSMFSGEHILPLFILKDQKLTVRVEFEYLDNNKKTMMPFKCVDANGLLVRVKTMRKEFFVGACDQSILTWNGQECSVQTSATKTRNSDDASKSPLGPPRIKNSRLKMTSEFNSGNFDLPSISKHEKDEDSPFDVDSIENFNDLWNVLHQTEPRLKSFDWTESDSSEDD